jgi:putative FmdB family regulatory protein
MPTYDYRCEGCGHELEIFQSITESPKRKCPECGTLRLKRVIGSGAGIIFKGSGFYQTDYRSESYKQAAQADGKKGEASKKKDDSGKKAGKSDSGKASGGSDAKD